MSDRRMFRWATTSARLLVGTIVAVAAVIAVVTAVSLSWPTLTREPVTVVAVPAPAASNVTCAGGILGLGRDLDDPGRLQVAASPAVTSGVGVGAPQPDAARLTVVDLDIEGPTSLTALPQGDERSDVAASASASVMADDLNGFAASACRPPLMESWLVAGSAATGAADLVLLSNPGVVPSTVQLTVFGGTGPQNPPGGADLVVPAGSQLVVPLAGLALGEESPIIRVTAQGAPIQAAMQTSVTRVLLPGGVDQVEALAATADTLTIAGVAVTQPPGEEGASNAATIARILSPTSDAGATVTVRRVGSRDAALAPISVPLAAGIPTEVSLGGLPVGVYTVEVVADAPVAAGVWQAAGFGEGADFAWYMPSPVIAVPSLFAVPAGPPATLTLVNPGDATAVVRIEDADGSESFEVDVAAGSTASVPLTRRQVFVIDPGDAAVQAAVSFAGQGALAGFPLWPADAAAPAMTVYP